MILEQLMKAKMVWVEGEEYVGLAADGVAVHVGTVGQENQTEAYLISHPTPDTW